MVLYSVLSILQNHFLPYLESFVIHYKTTYCRIFCRTNDKDLCTVRTVGISYTYVLYLRWLSQRSENSSEHPQVIHSTYMQHVPSSAQTILDLRVSGPISVQRTHVKNFPRSKQYQESVFFPPWRVAVAGPPPIHAAARRRRMIQWCDVSNTVVNGDSLRRRRRRCAAVTVLLDCGGRGGAAWFHLHRNWMTRTTGTSEPLLLWADFPGERSTQKQEQPNANVLA